MHHFRMKSCPLLLQEETKKKKKSNAGRSQATLTNDPRKTLKKVLFDSSSEHFLLPMRSLSLRFDVRLISPDEARVAFAFSGEK